VRVSMRCRVRGGGSGGHRRMRAVVGGGGGGGVCGGGLGGWFLVVCEGGVGGLGEGVKLGGGENGKRWPLWGRRDKQNQNRLIPKTMRDLRILCRHPVE